MKILALLILMLCLSACEKSSDRKGQGVKLRDTQGVTLLSPSGKFAAYFSNSTEHLSEGVNLVGAKKPFLDVFYDSRKDPNFRVPLTRLHDIYWLNENQLVLVDPRGQSLGEWHFEEISNGFIWKEQVNGIAPTAVNPSTDTPSPRYYKLDSQAHKSLRHRPACRLEPHARLRQPPAYGGVDRQRE